MDAKLLEQVRQLNPWLEKPGAPVIALDDFVPRVQVSELFDSEWDKYWTILIGPRRAGKTTLGKYLAQKLLEKRRYTELLYLNCDHLSIREWLANTLFVSEAMELFSLKRPILFIDEIQRVENPGLLLKSIIDLGLPIKHIATGSSQLEIKSKVQEFLTGRQLSSLILPFSHEEWSLGRTLRDVLVFGCYPQVLQSKKKELQLQEIYNQYVQKDIVEILKVGQPDTFQALVGLVAHSSGQLVNYNQLATDCRVGTTMIRNHLDILEQTFIIAKVKPFVGNKRSEITNNPIYYFLDNGFRNIALRNFSPIETRTDLGLLVEGFLFQEIYKFRAQHFVAFDIFFWRTKSGAEVDFVLYKNKELFLPIEVKFRHFQKPSVTRGFRSFIEAYAPKQAIIVTKDFIGKAQVDGCQVHFIPLTHLSKIFDIIAEVLQIRESA